MSKRPGLVEKAFAPEPGLKKRVFEAISTSPEHTSLFEDIARYTLSLQEPSAELPPSKKRKVEQNGDTGDIPATSLQNPRGYHKGTMEEEGHPEFEMPDVSFSIPIRKKMKFEMWGHGLAARDQKTGEGEWYMDGGLFHDAFRLPVPEKAQRQTMFILLPHSGHGILEPRPINNEPNPEPAVFSILDTPKTQAGARIVGEQIKRMFDDPDLLKDLKEQIAKGRNLEGMIETWIGRHRGMDGLIEPSEDEFVSAISEPHRKGEKAYHVKAFRGTKDGFLFFLRTGLIFTPKKPIIFFPFDAIKSISYSSVVQRTFSLNVATRVYRSSGGDEEKNSPWHENEFEFSHIDQKDFAGIDAWVKKHGLDDESLAAGRKAKPVAINRKKGSGKDEEAGDENSELRKAEKELEENAEEEEDSEDEREEDYDPGSEGDSEGSGTSDESDGENGSHRKGRNLVEEELGSEAEDVEDDEQGEREEEEEEEGGEEDENEVEEEDVEADEGAGVAFDDDDQL